MPIYAYKCSACDHEQDVLQKMSDPILTQCPQCQQETYVKQVTAAGFQLKGTGWYVTDFRNNDKGGAAASGRNDGAGASGAASDSAGSAPAPAASTSSAAPAAD